MLKKEVRVKYKALRQQLSEDELETQSIEIANQCLNLPIWEENTYHIFLPIIKQKEINTQYLLHILQGKDKNVVISKSNFKTTTLTHYLLTDQTKIKTNTWGIPEPENGLEIRENQIDVIFVPLLGFDLQGNRVGYGKGFYDIFLSKCKPTVKTIGLSFFEAEKQISDIHSQDFSLDYVVTPKKIYKFKEK